MAIQLEYMTLNACYLFCSVFFLIFVNMFSFQGASMVLIFLFLTSVSGRWYVITNYVVLAHFSCLYVDRRFEHLLYFSFFPLSLCFYLQKSQPNETWRQVNNKSNSFWWNAWSPAYFARFRKPSFDLMALTLIIFSSFIASQQKKKQQQVSFGLARSTSVSKRRRKPSTIYSARPAEVEHSPPPKWTRCTVNRGGRSTTCLVRWYLFDFVSLESNLVQQNQCFPIVIYRRIRPKDWCFRPTSRRWLKRSGLKIGLNR